MKIARGSVKRSAREKLSTNRTPSAAPREPVVAGAAETVLGIPSIGNMQQLADAFFKPVQVERLGEKIFRVHGGGAFGHFAR